VSHFIGPFRLLNLGEITFGVVGGGELRSATASSVAGKNNLWWPVGIVDLSDNGAVNAVTPTAVYKDELPGFISDSTLFTNVFRNMPARTSTTNLDAEHTDHIILEKIDSQRAPGEFTPVRNASPAMSTDERLDESKLESGSLRSSAEPGGRQPITHRPTGLRVFPSLI